MKRAAEKAKKEANNRARKSSHDTNKVDKAIAAQVILDVHLFFVQIYCKNTFFPTLPI
jgi:hypothetical protein